MLAAQTGDGEAFCANLVSEDQDAVGDLLASVGAPSTGDCAQDTTLLLNAVSRVPQFQAYVNAPVQDIQVVGDEALVYVSPPGGAEKLVWMFRKVDDKWLMTESGLDAATGTEA